MAPPVGLEATVQRKHKYLRSTDGTVSTPKAAVARVNYCRLIAVFRSPASAVLSRHDGARRQRFQCVAVLLIQQLAGHGRLRKSSKVVQVKELWVGCSSVPLSQIRLGYFTTRENKYIGK